MHAVIVHDYASFQTNHWKIPAVFFQKFSPVASYHYESDNSLLSKQLADEFLEPFHYSVVLPNAMGYNTTPQLAGEPDL